MAHHDTGEKIPERRRPGVMAADLVTLVRNKAVAFHGGAELQTVERLAMHGRHRPARLALLARPTLSKLSRGNFFQIRFHLEHHCLQLVSREIKKSFSKPTEDSSLRLTFD